MGEGEPPFPSGGGGSPELARRIGTALVLGPMLVAAVLWLPTSALGWVLALFVACGAWEWARLQGWSGGGSLAYAGASVALLVVIGGQVTGTGSPPPGSPATGAAEDVASLAVLLAGAGWWMAELVRLLVRPAPDRPVERPAHGTPGSGGAEGRRNVALPGASGLHGERGCGPQARKRRPGPASTGWRAHGGGRSPSALAGAAGGWVRGWLILVPAWVALLWLHATFGPRGIGALLAIVWGADIGAYFAGRRWGRHRLAPAISPGKTWEGAGGGLALAIGTALGLGLLGWWPAVGTGTGTTGAGSGWIGFEWLPVVGVTVAISIVGDLTESAEKRRAGVKDSGRILPGHGGILDRIDSLTAAAPVFALLCRLLIAQGGGLGE